MATIPNNDITRGTGETQNLTVVALDGSDDFTQTTGTLYLVNTSGSPVTITIDGDEASATHYCTSAGVKDLSSGFEIAVPANGVSLQLLSEISAYLAGTIAVTGGTSAIMAYIIS